MLLFPKMRVTRKIFTRVAANLFFNQFSGDILSSSLVSFAFFDSYVFLLFVCCFLKLKMYILKHMRLCGRVSDEKIFTGRFPETRLLFFWSY